MRCQRPIQRHNVLQRAVGALAERTASAVRRVAQQHHCRASLRAGEGVLVALHHRGARGLLREHRRGGLVGEGAERREALGHEPRQFRRRLGRQQVGRCAVVLPAEQRACPPPRRGDGEDAELALGLGGVALGARRAAPAEGVHRVRLQPGGHGRMHHLQAARQLAHLTRRATDRHYRRAHARAHAIGAHQQVVPLLFAPETHH
mmetsp:Transcript_16387/g.50909  ORF Transcript_16387/g.50909 Transcript_16387/m.50909 type:complete len:204 (+) Transcript_16387:344-955(+)